MNSDEAVEVLEEQDCAGLSDSEAMPDSSPDARTSESNEAADALAAAGLGPRGGQWGGAEAPVNRAQAIGRRNGLSVTSRKRSSGSGTSDHSTAQRSSDAVDLSNGTRPTPQMDRTAAQIAALLGVPGWRGGNLVRRINGYRVQLLYKTNIGGNHYNHVHVGVRVGG